MGFCEVHIAPEPRRVIESLRGDLKEKIKNALREISSSEEAGVTLVVASEASVIPAPHRRTAAPGARPPLGQAAPSSSGTPRNDGNTAASLSLYKAGRFRILFRRNDECVWIEALVLNNPNHFSSAVSGGHRP